MSFSRRRRKGIRTIIAELQAAVEDLNDRVDALEEDNDIEWAEVDNVGVGSTAPTGNIGVGTTVTIPTETLLSLITPQNINTFMSEGNVGIGSSTPNGNVGVGSTTAESAPAGDVNAGIGDTASVGNVGNGNIGIGSSAPDGNVGIGS
tara:strand:- start:32 stop:475 length:444 start_codon:yes stop_codon:yes gene_type:complete